MKIESVLRSINRRIKEYVDVFGIDSVEYAWAKNLFFIATGSANVPIGKRSGGIVQFSRSKATLEHIYENQILEENLRNVWEAMKSKGTTKQIIEREYLQNPATQEWLKEEGLSVSDIMNDPEAMGDIRGESIHRAEAAYDDTDIYEDVDEEIEKVENMEDIQELADIQGMFYEEGKGIEKDAKWHRIQKAWGDYKHRKEREDSMKAAETEPE